MNITSTKWEILYFFHQVLHTYLPEDCFSTKDNIDNYDGLINLKEHI
jgi:hypothetical protein